VLLHFNAPDATTGFFDDNFGGSAHVWTAAGNAQIDTAQSKFGGSSGLFDGTGDWISTPDSADFTLGTGDFTVDFWARPAVDASLIYLCGQGDHTPSATTSSVIISRNDSNKIVCEISNGSAFTTLTSTTSVVTGSFFHIALVRTGTTLNLHIN